uniref:Uncharacterized protein n=1 Tax=Fibrocapsa japonica TaxID=94617 RepID=A0A7S2XZ06_9STRA
MEADLPTEHLSELFNINHFIISQVNPHAALLSNLSLEGSVWINPVYGMFLGLLHFLKSQVRAWLRHAIELIVLQRKAPSWSTRRGFSQIITQEYQGRDCDITISPWSGYETVLSAFMKMLANPSKQEYTEMVHRGERNTFPTVARVRSHCAVEMELETCVQKLRKKLTLERDEVVSQSGPARDRVPSFYTSSSCVDLSGLTVTDQTATHFSRTTEGRQLSLTQLDQEGESSDENEIAIASSNEPNLPRRRSLPSVPASPYDADHDAEAARTFREKSAESEASLPSLPNSSPDAMIPLHTAVAGSGVYKSTSMSNFYYRQNKSQEHLPALAVQGK